MQETIEKIRDAYQKELRKRLDTDPEYAWPDKSDEAIARVVNKIFTAFSRPGDRSDWLKYNPALKIACKAAGVKSSS